MIRICWRTTWDGAGNPIGQETEIVLVGLGVLVEMSNVFRMSCIGFTFAANVYDMMVCFHSSSSGNKAMWGEKCSSDDENHTSEMAPDGEMHVASSFFLGAASQQILALLWSFILQCESKFLFGKCKLSRH